MNQVISPACSNSRELCVSFVSLKPDESTEDHHPMADKFVEGSSSNAPSSRHTEQFHAASQQNPANFTQPISASASRNYTISGPRSNHSVSHVGSPLSLADRKMVAASQISRRLIVMPSASAARPNQTIPRLSQFSSRHPNSADTASSQLKPLHAHDLAKYRKSSELARSIVLPTTGTGASANAKNKRKSKYTPPLVR